MQVLEWIVVGEFVDDCLREVIVLESKAVSHTVTRELRAASHSHRWAGWLSSPLQYAFPGLPVMSFTQV